MSGGYIAVHRKTLHRSLGTDDDILGFWVRLLLAANWKPGWFHGREIKPGQIVLSDRGMQERLYPGATSPPAIATIKRRLDLLEETGAIKIEIQSGRKGGRVVTIRNWAKYQSVNARGFAPVPSANVSANPSADIRRIKKGKNKPSSSRKRDGVRVYSEQFERWWTHYPRKVGKPSAARAFDSAIKRIAREQSLATADALAWLISRTEAYARHTGDVAAQHVKHPGPWLNDDRFADELADKRKRTDDDVPLLSEVMQ